LIEFAKTFAMASCPIFNSPRYSHEKYSITILGLISNMNIETLPGFVILDGAQRIPGIGILTKWYYDLALDICFSLRINQISDLVNA